MDVFDSDAGNDTLSGDKGNDTYLFKAGSGQDKVSDYDSTIGNVDTIQMQGIAPSSLPFLHIYGNMPHKIHMHIQ